MARLVYFDIKLHQIFTRYEDSLYMFQQNYVVKLRESCVVYLYTLHIVVNIITNIVSVFLQVTVSTLHNTISLW